MALLDVAHRRVALEVVRFWAAGDAIPKHWENDTYDTISPQKPTFCINGLKCGTLSAQPYIYHHFSTLYCTNHNARLVKSGHRLAKHRYSNPPLSESSFAPSVCIQSALRWRKPRSRVAKTRKPSLRHMWDDPRWSLAVLSGLGLQTAVGSCHLPSPKPFPIASNARALWPRDFGVWQCQNRRNQHIDRSSATRASCRNPSAKDLQPGCQLITTCPYTDIAIHFHVCPKCVKIWNSTVYCGLVRAPPSKLCATTSFAKASPTLQHMPGKISSLPTSPRVHLTAALPTPHASNLASLGTRKNGSFDCSGLGHSAWRWSGGHEVRMISKDRYLDGIWRSFTKTDVEDVYVYYMFDR